MFNANEAIQIDAELYNESYELVNEVDATAVVKATTEKNTRTHLTKPLTHTPSMQEFYRLVIIAYWQKQITKEMPIQPIVIFRSGRLLSKH